MYTNVLGKRISYRLLLLICTVILSCTSCKKIYEIRPTSFEFVSLNPQGLSSADVDFKVGIDNPTLQVRLSDIFVEVILNGKIIGDVTVAPFVMEARTEKVYDMSALVALRKGSSIFNLLPLLKGAKAVKDINLNIRVKATLKGGLSKTFVWEEVPMEELIKLAE